MGGTSSDDKLLSAHLCELIYRVSDFLVVYGKQKRFSRARELIFGAIIDAGTLNSGIIIFSYTAGKIFQLEYFTEVDTYSLYVALIISGLVIIGEAIDKLKLKEDDKNGKNGKK